MRKVSNWYQDIRKKLYKSTALQEYVNSIPDRKVREQEIKRLIRLIANVELGFTLLEQVAPGEPATSAAALLSGYRYTIPQLENDGNWQTVQIARFYLARIKGKRWEREVEEYIRLPQVIRIYSLDAASSVPRIIPSSTADSRSQIYQRTLSRTPKHKDWIVNLATGGRWFCTVSQQGNSAVEVPIDIPAAVAAIAPSDQIYLIQHSREAQNPPATVTWDELLETAGQMEQKYPHGKWYECLNRIDLKLYDPETNDFQPGSVLRLEQLIQIVGLLNVGKSKLLEVLTYHFAKQGNRCALMVNDVVTAVRTAAIFWHHLGIEAAPVLGQDRQTQLKQVHETILVEEGEEITQGGIHFALRWFSPVCPLLALVQSEDIWEFGKEPCHSLYQKKSPQQLNNVDANEDEDENDGEDRKEYFTCPLYYKCPRHQLEQDIAIARIWVLTPASFIQTRVPRQVFREKITFAEAVYRECRFLFVDEADRVQIQFDDAFAPNDVLVDASEQAYLNKVGRYTSSIYHSARDRMAADRVVAWLSAQYYVQNVTNRIYNRLLTHEKLAQKHDKRETLADWLGLQPFTGRSLFAKIIREVTEPDNNNSQQYRKQTRQQRIEALRQRTATPSPSQQQLQQKRRELLQELETFIPKPLDLECELSVLTLRLLQPGDDQQAIAEVEKWCRKWLETDIKVFNKNIDYEELTRNVHFAILITVLEDQLAYLVDYLPYVRTILDLQDLDDNLLKRPPFDYLAVVPESPVGNILGFFYTRDLHDNSRGGKLEYFRYIGVGRALLLRFPTLFAIDGWEGPHTILISGTSYAPGSPKFQNSLYYTPPAYHIDVKPTVLLQPKPLADSARNTGIDASRFYFRPLPGYGGMPISISGCHSARKQNVRDLIQALCSPAAGGLKLNDVFQSLSQLGENTQTQEEWADRKRFLMITGSYDEAEWAHAIAQPLCPDIPLEPLRRDQAPPNLRGIRRSKIQSLKDTPIQGIFAPLMALERGYNVLNQYDKAAFGAALFLNRPMPVPDDWASSVQQLNAWALKHEQDSRLFDINQPLTLIAAADAFYLNATNKLRELNSTAYSFRHMTDEERDILCWNQLVKVWQIIGRLVRGNVPAEVYFLDAKFAPFSAEGLTDKASTSLLVGMIEALEAHVEGEGLEPYQLSLARSLYSDFLTALKNTDGLKF